MRYINELPANAITQFLAQREAAMCGDRTAQEHLTVLDGAYWGAPSADLFDVLAVEIGRGRRGADGGRRTAALIALFGEEDVPEVVRLCNDVFEEVETQNASRLSRIVRRINNHKSSPADLAWLLVQAEALTDDLILTASPFEGDQDGAEELRRQVVRARKPWVCHWTRRPITLGERHLAIVERYDGKVLTTRHSLLSVYLDVAGEDPAAAIELAPAEHRRAA
ncbi:hypothetical protein [Methylobacterium brachythecii]|uniref:Uncharacterized protein n=1 Tax=Methylobacterium brachythecii TaxID=1176177 RepID=A0A7W6AMG6_9HYPH|nr:hypothetical protein [Methylobacterium brachythecii]MBB3905308.1 hypothetical protein [Methylobacterium brachythecii]GLS45918.1 hypothetical protein GCM10007884_39090 [Methylobacterium brachythecii]